MTTTTPEKVGAWTKIKSWVSWLMYGEGDEERQASRIERHRQDRRDALMERLLDLFDYVSDEIGDETARIRRGDIEACPAWLAELEAIHKTIRPHCMTEPKRELDSKRDEDYLKVLRKRQKTLKDMLANGEGAE